MTGRPNLMEQQSALIPPYGGRLVKCVVEGEERSDQ